MTIEITDKLVGMWQFGFPGGDFLGAITRLDDSYKLDYRFRYHVDDKTHDSEDIKNWYGGMISCETDAQAINVMRKVMDKLSMMTKDDYTEILMRDNDVNAFVEELKAQEFSHMQTVETH